MEAFVSNQKNESISHVLHFLKKTRKWIDRISLYSEFWTHIKRKLRTFFQKIFNQNYMIVLNLKTKLFIASTLIPVSVHLFVKTLFIVSMILPLLYFLADLYCERSMEQGTNARKVNCGRVYSAYILKPVLSGRNL